MVLLILMPDRWDDAIKLRDNLRRLDRSLEVRIWPESGDESSVDVIVSWRHPAGVLRRFENLKLLVSFGAGAEHLLTDDGVPDDLPIVRTVDPVLIRDMVGYVVTVINNHRRGFFKYQTDQRAHRWNPQAYQRMPVALVLGMGRLGSATARTLADLGYRVVGWSRKNRRDEGGLEVVVGWDELFRVLPEADSVTCLLPLTPQTRDMLDASFFARMKEGSLLVNAGRGGHLVERDLVEALDRDRPGHAVLDVFREEPLPDDHPFWEHPKITITPHVAALTDPFAAAERVVESCRRLRAGEPLLDRVDLERGY